VIKVKLERCIHIECEKQIRDKELEKLKKDNEKCESETKDIKEKNKQISKELEALNKKGGGLPPLKPTWVEEVIWLVSWMTKSQFELIFLNARKWRLLLLKLPIINRLNCA